MRLWSCAPLSLLALTLAAAAAQLPWQAPTHAQSATLVDVLSGDQDYSLLLALLQRARLIPTLNKLNGSTFFAPTNDAVRRRASSDALWHSLLSDPPLVPDNIQEQLRQQLFYHLLNRSLAQLPKDASTQFVETLHFPQPQDSPSRDPPPWIPIPHGLLGDHPQRLRLASRDGTTRVGVDASGNGGVKVVKEKVEASNGIVYGIEGMLKPPPDLMAVVRDVEPLSYFRKVLTSDIERVLNSSAELTLFMPLDAAWESLDPLERLYLESAFAADDLHRILDMHLISEHGVKWSDSFQSNTKLTTKYGSTLQVTVTPQDTTISGAKLVERDIYASNGVLHLVSSLLIPPGALQLTPEKYLLALNCSSFVSLLHSVDLEHLINNTDKQLTILAPKDDVLSLFPYFLPESGSPDLKRALKYHFLPGLWKPNKFYDGMLLETELHELGLDGRQVIKVDVRDAGSVVAERHITFGGAGMIGEHVEINNTIIYFISRPLEPPVDPLQTALPTLDLSSFLAAVFSTSLADVIKRMPRTTFLIPHNSAFKRLGLLVSDHLLAASSKKDLENVILHHIIGDVQYAKSLVNGSQRTFATLEGSDLQLDRPEGGPVTITASGGWAGRKSALYPQDTLTDTGVIHEVSDLMIPRSVELTIGKLMKAGKATTMTSIMAKAGFDWILNGTSPPESSEFVDMQVDSGGTWTLLCPTDDAFKKYNLTKLFQDLDGLREIVRQHLVPTHASPSNSISGPDVLDNSLPLPLDQLGGYRTLLSSSSSYGDVVFKEMEDKSAAGYMVGIKNARGTDGKADWARVLSWGRTTTGGGTGGVIQIDQLLLPYKPSWWREYGPPFFVGGLGVVLICLFFYGARIFWNRDQTEATYEPIGGFARGDDES